MKKHLSKIIEENIKESPSVIASKILEQFELHKRDDIGDLRFEQFWSAYPKKVARKAALKMWSRIKMTDELFAKILKMLDGYKKSPQWRKDAGQFIPHASTWLNQERWNDELKVGNEDNSRFENL